MNAFTEKQLGDALELIEASIRSCEKVQPKFKEGSASLTISKNRIKALYLVKALLTTQEIQATQEDLEEALVQMTSLRNKSTTGLHNAKKGSGTETRFSRILAAMDIALAYLQQAIGG